MPTNTAHKVPATTSQSKTAETKIKKDKEIKPAVRIQQLKNNLIILGHELKVNKKINDTLYRKIQLLTYSRTTEQKLIESYNTLKNLKRDITKSELLQGPTKIKKVTLKDFNKVDKESKKPKAQYNNDIPKQHDLVQYKGIINERMDNIHFHFYNNIIENYLFNASEEYLQIKKYKLGINKDYAPVEQTEHTNQNVGICITFESLSKSFEIFQI